MIKTCTHCDHPVLAKGLCKAHYQRKRRGYDLDKPRRIAKYEGQTCSVKECIATAAAGGLCMPHYMRRYTKLTIGESRPSKGSYLLSTGYRLIKSNGALVMEHRKVMSEIIGRPLEPWENVHHRNGCREDNRPENLELWVKRQPPGQRGADLVAWAREIIERYGHLYP